MQYLTDVSAHRTSTGLNNRKLLMWAFLGSDVLFFGTLIATHLVYRGQSVSGPTEAILDIPITSISTFVLLMSSLAMVLALAAVQQGDISRGRFWLAATALLGMMFIGFQMFEFTEFAHEGLTPRTNLFGSTFLIMTGFHGAHVTVGILWLWSLFFASFDGKVRQDNSLDVEIAGLYWHFVDIVWIVIFGVVYLIGAYGVEETVHASMGTLSALG
jgi:heme/copper-type cytochrome/quinol oxidase subunit 3